MLQIIESNSKFQQPRTYYKYRFYNVYPVRMIAVSNKDRATPGGREQNTVNYNVR